MAEANLPAPAAGAVMMGDGASPNTGPNAAVPASFGDLRGRWAKFVREPAFQRALPAVVGVGVVAVAAALYLAIADGPQRLLYGSISDGDRAQVVQVLEAEGISYNIDNATGAVTVAEKDFHLARMRLASDTGLAAPEGASAMLDAIPLGSSRTLEGERLRLARERELMLTIREIDGIDSVRVHLATPERSVFVRDATPPSASVMLRLTHGRSLSQSQVEAIVNLVSGSVPGMTVDDVRVVDQNGRLLSAPREDRLDALVLQREFEAKLREQVGQLLLPLLGEGKFSSQVQVQLDHEEITSARESYDQDGVIRSETERSSTRSSGAANGGIPGVVANTPPPDPQLVDAAPEGDVAADAINGAANGPTDSETSAMRNYELGREVAVTSRRPGGLVRLSVAVAVSEAALEAANPLTVEQLQSLISAAVGADEGRGDQIEVVVSAFEGVDQTPLAFYEQKWFTDVMRLVAALLAVVMVLLLGVRPLIKRIWPAKDAKNADQATPALADNSTSGDVAAGGQWNMSDQAHLGVDEHFPQKVELARQLAASQPDRAVEALQRMLELPDAGAASLNAKGGAPS